MKKSFEKRQEKILAQLRFLAENLLDNKGKVNNKLKFPEELNFDDDDDDLESKAEKPTIDKNDSNDYLNESMERFNKFN
jgi:hypothetical protein